MRMKKFIKCCCILIICLIALFVLSVLFNPFNPMQQAFITSFDFKNGTKDTVFLTPIGTSLEGKKVVLRQFRQKVPAVEVKNRANHPVGAGQTLKIFYESDDYCLSEILVKNSESQYKQLTVDRNTTGCDQVKPKEAFFEISTLSQLSEPHPTLQGLVTPK